ncbi:MAG: hypothetical protein ABI382_06675 [Nakamurella sp.]
MAVATTSSPFIAPLPGLAATLVDPTPDAAAIDDPGSVDPVVPVLGSVAFDSAVANAVDESADVPADVAWAEDTELALGEVGESD